MKLEPLAYIGISPSTCGEGRGEGREEGRRKGREGREVRGEERKGREGRGGIEESGEEERERSQVRKEGGGRGDMCAM